MTDEIGKLRRDLATYEKAMKEAATHILWCTGAKERKARSVLLRALGYRSTSEFREANHILDPRTAFIIDPIASNSMKSKNPNSGVHRTEYAPTLDTSTQNPIRNAGGLLIVQ